MSNCKMCRYYRVKILYSDETKNIYGECRFNAPVRFEDSGKRFPVVYETEWCGQFKSKKRQDND
jgi:hypothetical protein